MEIPEYPHDRLHQEIVQALDGSRLTTVGLGRVLGAETDLAPKTCEQRIRRLRSGLPIQVIDLVSLMDAIGYEVAIRPKLPRNFGEPPGELPRK
jgi:hypothetical protein